MKNPSPRALAWYAGGAVAVLAVVVQEVLSLWVRSPLWQPVLLGGIVGLGAYFLFSYILNRFIYRKIKLIYKTIHNLKVDRFTREVLGQSVGNDPINEVQQEVSEWAERNQRELESLRKAEQYRKEFLSNLSHEFKTPLFSIQGYVHTLLDGAMDDKEVSHHFLEKTAQGIERLVTLVNDLEQIARLESGEETLDLETFDIYSLTRDVFEEIEYKANTKQIRFSVKKGCDRPFYVVADKERIRQVLVNLLDNSIKYGRENGNTIVSYYDMGDNVLIEVTDDGIGIAEEHIPRLFERFYRVDKSRSREQGGTGLGLAIVKHIIEAHQQTINVRSKPGVGSTFGFTLAKADER
ncbi:MAG: ATP-binding protein [Chitinophagales bacterium]|nr:ATP-binding protein [Chitinophagales bacterium]MDW8428414.1 ATP-binding protein [Chitinophagales bacterium]